MAGAFKGIVSAVTSVFSPPKEPERPPVPQPPPPPDVDRNAQAAAATKGAAAAADLASGGKQSTVFAGELGSSDQTKQKKRLLGY